MTKTQAQASAKSVVTELLSLNPSTLIQLFEIDITNIAVDMGIYSQSDSLFNISNGIFRFHNNIKLLNTSIFWKGNEYVAVPILVEGFEMNSKGTLPTPKLRLAVGDDGVNLLATLKQKIYELGDLVGAKFTRIRTFAKYLDSRNFLTENNSLEAVAPDNNVELPRDVYYIDRKSNENKQSIEYEMASILDIEGVKLPSRLVIANKCMWQYRGEGCCYEYSNRRSAVHNSANLLNSASPVANDKDEKIADILGITTIIDKGLYTKNVLYMKGDAVFITKNNINYYFVAKSTNPLFPPPDTRYWIMDSCSKSTLGCKLRFSSVGDGTLPYGGFPATNRLVG